MQRNVITGTHKSNLHNNSRILRDTESAQKKSRRKLIGSIVLLLLALLFLLHVTSKVKPIPIDPQTIEIQTVAANNKVVVQKISSDLATGPIKNIASGNIVQNNTMELNTTNQQQSINHMTNSLPNDTKIKSNNSTEQINNAIKFHPKLVIEKSPNKLTPQQILNGMTEEPLRYYVQILASTNQNDLIKPQEELSKQKIKTFIQQIKTTDGISIYRLRIGPFSNKEDANTQINNLKVSYANN